MVFCACFFLLETLALKIVYFPKEGKIQTYISYTFSNQVGSGEYFLCFFVVGGSVRERMHIHPSNKHDFDKVCIHQSSHWLYVQTHPFISVSVFELTSTVSQVYLVMGTQNPCMLS